MGLTRCFILVTNSSVPNNHPFDLVALRVVTINIHVTFIKNHAAFSKLAELVGKGLLLLKQTAHVALKGAIVMKL